MPLIKSLLLLILASAGLFASAHAQSGNFAPQTARAPGLALPAQKASSPFASIQGNHVGLRVADYDAAKRWYVEKLDFRVVHEWLFGDQRLAYIAPATDDRFFIELLGDGERPTPKPAYNSLNESAQVAGYHHISFNVTNLNQLLAELRRRDVKIASPTFPSGGH